MWQKLIENGVHGSVLDIIQDMYKKAKSCVRVDNQYSDYFQCFIGVRKGENLSPLLFAIYLNDLQKSFMLERMNGLSPLREIACDNVSEDQMLKNFLLLYADDTATCAENIEDMQAALDAMSEYCNRWKLKITVAKTKVLVFSRGKIRNVSVFQYDRQNVQVVHGFEYLGIYFIINST